MTTSHLSLDDLAALRRALEAERATMTTARDRRAPVERAGLDDEIEPGDVAERMIEQDEALRLAALDTSHLRDVEDALAKLDGGTYGFSEESGAPIPLARLRAAPWARRTLEEEERR